MNPADPASPREALTAPSHTEEMERGLSSGSDSSLSTQQLEKSPESDRASVASPAAQQGVSAGLRSWLAGKSPFGGKGQVDEDDDRQSTNKTAKAERGKKQTTEEKVAAADYEQSERPIAAGASDSEVDYDDEEEQEGLQRPCFCCKSCTAEDVVDNVMSIICFPCYVFQTVIMCLCCKCPRMLVDKAKESKESVKAGMAGIHEKEQEPKFQSAKEVAEPEGESSVHDSASVKGKEKMTETAPREASGLEPTTRAAHDEVSEDKTETGGSEDQRSSFFPNPETDDDRR